MPFFAKKSLKFIKLTPDHLFHLQRDEESAAVGKAGTDSMKLHFVLKLSGLILILKFWTNIHHKTTDLVSDFKVF
jgi:hypothetical protein